MIGFRPGSFSPRFSLAGVAFLFLTCSNRTRPVQGFLLGLEAACDHPRAAAFPARGRWLLPEQYYLNLLSLPRGSLTTYILWTGKPKNVSKITELISGGRQGGHPTLPKPRAARVGDPLGNSALWRSTDL